MLKRTAIIIAPHPDDEVISCAGLIQRLHKVDFLLKVVFITDGEACYNHFHQIGPESGSIKQIRREESQIAQRIFGIDPENSLWCGLPDGQLASEENTKLVRKILTKIISDFSPQLVIAPNSKDGHLDHATIGDAIIQISENRKRGHTLMYQLWPSSKGKTNKPTAVIRLTEEEIRLKNRALDCFKSQFMPIRESFPPVIQRNVISVALEKFSIL